MYTWSRRLRRYVFIPARLAPRLRARGKRVYTRRPQRRFSRFTRFTRTNRIAVSIGRRRFAGRRRFRGRS